MRFLGEDIQTFYLLSFSLLYLNPVLYFLYSFIYFLFLKYFYLFLALPDLPCRTRFSLVAVCGLPVVVAPLVVESRLQGTLASVLAARGLSV